MLVESAATTLLGKLFHTEITLLQKSASLNYSACVIVLIVYVASCVEDMTNVKVNHWIIIILSRNYIIDLDHFASQSSIFQC